MDYTEPVSTDSSYRAYLNVWTIPFYISTMLVTTCNKHQPSSIIYTYRTVHMVLMHQLKQKSSLDVSNYFQCISWTRFNFFSRTEIFPMEDKLSPGHNMASSSLRKMFTLINFNTLGVWVLVCPTIFMDTVVNSSLDTTVYRKCTHTDQYKFQHLWCWNLSRLTFSSDLRKPCWDLVKACLPLEKIFCPREKN